MIRAMLIVIGCICGSLATIYNTYLSIINQNFVLLVGNLCALVIVGFLAVLLIGILTK